MPGIRADHPGMTEPFADEMRAPLDKGGALLREGEETILCAVCLFSHEAHFCG